MVKGRTEANTGPLPLDTLVTSTPLWRPDELTPEQIDIMERCKDTISVAEIAAHFKVHLGVARVLVGDLLEAGLVTISKGFDNDSGPDLTTLEKLYHELRHF